MSALAPRRPLPATVGFTVLLAMAVAVRLTVFAGPCLGDEITYTAQVIAHAGGAWPPEPTHWTTRLGLTLPTTLSVLLFGLGPWSLTLVPFVCGAVKAPVYWLCARRLTDAHAAWLAGILVAVYPLEVVFSVHLFPDVVVGLCSTLGLLAFARGLERDSPAAYGAAGLALALGYACRETVVLEVPIYAALWLTSGRLWRPKLVWCAAAPLALLAGELALYASTTGNAWYRVDAVLAQVNNPADHELAARVNPGGGFLGGPLVMVAASHELGAFLLLGLPLGVVALRRWPRERVLAVWLLVGFVWLYYGTTSPTDWVPMHREPRYAGVLTLPAVVLVARFATALGPRLRFAFVGLLIASSLLATSLDEGTTVLAPHRAFAASPFAPQATVEPAEYVAARLAIGLDRTPSFWCADGIGRHTTRELIGSLAGTTVAPTDARRYLVLAPGRRTALSTELEGAGWKPVHEFAGEATAGRRLVARLLALLPSQEERAGRLRRPPGLVVLERAGR